MNDLTGPIEPVVVIPIGMDCQDAKCPTMIKTKDGWINIWIEWIQRSK